MTAHVELEQAARLQRAEQQWLDQCADRLRRAGSPSPSSPRPAAPRPDEQVDVR